MRNGSFAAAFAAAFVVAFSLGAKGCSNCEKARAEAEITCQTEGEDSTACKLARIDAAKVCKPEPTPPPPTPQPIPDPQCSVTGASHSCWHWPPDSTMPLYACPVYDANGGVVGVLNVTGGPAQCPPKPTPPPTTCPEVCPAGSHCEGTTCVPNTPPPSGPTNCDGEPGQPTGQTTSTFGVDVNNAMKEITGCSIGSDCPLGNTTNQAFFRAVIDKLRSKGICAGQHEPGHTDEIAVSSSQTAIREGYHIFSGDDSQGPVPPGGAPRKVVWSPGAARPSYHAGVTPTPEPPPVNGCSSPLPPFVWTSETLPDGWGQDEIGNPRWKLACKPHNKVIDCTPQVTPHACEYCASIGMGDFGGQPRCGCPVRNECGSEVPPTNFKCTERVACETYLTGGTKLESRNGATCEKANDNPMQFYPNGGNCRLVSVRDPRVFSDWY